MAAALAVPALALRFAAGKMAMPKGEIPVAFMLLREALSAFAVWIATWAMTRIERRSFAAYGFAPQRRPTLLLAGLAGGIACLSLLVLGLYAAGFSSIALALHGTLPALLYGAIWLFGFFLVGFSEEAMFRGYLLANLARGLGFWPAALIMGLIFGAVHLPNGGETPIGIAEVVVAAIAFTVLLRLTGSLWASIGFHAGWDWAQSYLWGTPDSGLMFRGHLLATHAAGAGWISGGSTGPEGSVFALPAFALGAVLVWGMVRGTKEGILPS